MTRIRHRRFRGQAMVEFALVLPLFLLLLFAFIDVGRYVYSTTAYGQAAREGARWGSVEQWAFECPVGVSPTDPPGLHRGGHDAAVSRPARPRRPS